MQFQRQLHPSENNRFMETTHTLDELIFANRNQAYGAFALRRGYRSTINRALLAGSAIFLLGIGMPTVYRLFADKLPKDEQMIAVDMTPIQVQELKEEPIPIRAEEPLPQQTTVRDLPPVVLPDEEVLEENLPPTIDELAEAKPGEQTVEGTGDVEEIIAPVESAAPTVQEKAVEVAPPKSDEPFLFVEQQPEFPGGMEALAKFLQKSLQYPGQAARSNISGRVFVSFIVGTDGTLTDVQVPRGIGFGCDEEAIRVVKAMPRWKPGKQSGRAVRVRYNLPIVFALE